MNRLQNDIRLEDENDDNEVSITYSLDDQSIGICFGDEHGVNPLSDTQSAHLLMSGKALTVVSLHNHPSTQSFSLEDIQFFIDIIDITDNYLKKCGQVGIDYHKRKEKK